MHTSLITGKSYIGQTTYGIEKRWKKHIRDSRNQKRTTHFGRAIAKYGSDTWVHKVLLDNIPYTLLCMFEQLFIETFDTYYNGYNSTLGGEGTLGKTLSEKHIETLKKVHSGNTYGVGYKHPKEVLQKMSNSHKGKKLPESVVQKLKERTGFKHHNSKVANIYCYTTKKCLYENVCLREWARTYGYSQSAISNTARGNALHHKNMYAVYV